VKILIVNADDFGQSPGVNQGVMEAHEHGIVTSATVMVRWPSAAEAAEYAKSRPALSLGLHLDLAEWNYTDGGWVPRYEVTPPDDESAIRAEIQRQLEAFSTIVGRPPTHIDSHQHVHRNEPVTRLLAEAGRSLGVPVRDMAPGITYSGMFYGQDARGHPIPEAISVKSLVSIIRDLPEGTTELGCHPGDGMGLDSMYERERAVEVATLCSSSVRSALIECGVQLRSFADLELPDRGTPSPVTGRRPESGNTDGADPTR
jgi:predicted glycoside hydrolase/deacetylase ChbG (UPF0249 family)